MKALLFSCFGPNCKPIEKPIPPRTPNGYPDRPLETNEYQKEQKRQYDIDHQLYPPLKHLHPGIRPLDHNTRTAHAHQYRYDTTIGPNQSRKPQEHHQNPPPIQILHITPDDPDEEAVDEGFVEVVEEEGGAVEAVELELLQAVGGQDEGLQGEVGEFYERVAREAQQEVGQQREQGEQGREGFEFVAPGQGVG